MLWLPLAGLAYLVGQYVDRKLALVLTMLLAPIPFYFAAKYLRSLDGGDWDVSQDTGNPLRTKIIVSTAVALLCGYLLSPPDLITEITAGVPMAFLCGISLLILSRFRFMKSASPSVQTLVCALTCAVAVLLTVCLLFGLKSFSV
jgi:hypothetical protein